MYELIKTGMKKTPKDSWRAKCEGTIQGAEPLNKDPVTLTMIMV